MSDITAMFEHTCVMSGPDGPCGKEANHLVKWRAWGSHGIWWLCDECFQLYIRNKNKVNK